MRKLRKVMKGLSKEDKRRLFIFNGAFLIVQVVGIVCIFAKSPLIYLAALAVFLGLALVQVVKG